MYFVSQRLVYVLSCSLPYCIQYCDMFDSVIMTFSNVFSGRISLKFCRILSFGRQIYHQFRHESFVDFSWFPDFLRHKKSWNHHIVFITLTRERLELQMEKEARKNQLNSVGHNNSHDSAIDADLQEWELEKVWLELVSEGCLKQAPSCRTSCTGEQWCRSGVNFVSCLIHWGRDKIDAILQTTFSNAI